MKIFIGLISKYNHNFPTLGFYIPAELMFSIAAKTIYTL